MVFSALVQAPRESIRRVISMKEVDLIRGAKLKHKVVQKLRLTKVMQHL